MRGIGMIVLLELATVTPGIVGATIVTLKFIPLLELA
tara:strand:+ start:816 stop:926 length:111 start_codon:yes stop_codon:yes gene_type:complete